MARPLKEIEQELPHLPQVERARLAHRLIVSLDEDLPPDEGIEAAWLEEIKTRESTLRILAVAHQRRRPGYWKGRE